MADGIPIGGGGGGDLHQKNSVVVPAPAPPSTSWEEYYHETDGYWTGDTHSGPAISSSSSYYGWSGRGNGTENYYHFGDVLVNTEHQGKKDDVGNNRALTYQCEFVGDGSSEIFYLYKNIGLSSPFSWYINTLKTSRLFIRGYSGTVTIASSPQFIVVPSTCMIGDLTWEQASVEQRGNMCIEVMDSTGQFVAGLKPPSVWYNGTIYWFTFTVVLGDE